MKLIEAVQRGDYRESLIALRDEIAAAIERTDSARDEAALAKRLMDVLAEIETLPDPNEPEDPVQQAIRLVAEDRAKAMLRNAEQQSANEIADA